MFYIFDPYLITGINVILFLIFSVSFIIYRLIFPKKKINYLLLLILISILPILSLYRPGTFEAGDMRAHTAQLLDFYSNLKEGIIVPRWSATLCGKFGCPIFIIEYTTPYYLGSIFHSIGFSALTSIKLVLSFSFIASGITMYYWAKNEYGNLAGFVAALLYIFTPYHLTNIHFKGAVGESLSFVFVPLLFIFAKKCIELKSAKYLTLLSLTIVAIILAHAFTAMVFVPISFGYGLIYWYIKKKKDKNALIFYISAVISGLLLSSFYTIPAIIEVRYTWWSLPTDIEFNSIKDNLISPFYYGFLFQGSNGGWSPIVGYMQILLFFTGIYLLLKNKFIKKYKYILIYFILLALLMFFMLTPLSKPIWEIIGSLGNVFFVYRMFSPLSFLMAAIGGYTFLIFRNKKIIAIVCFLIISTTILNWANRQMVPPLNNPFLNGDTVYIEYFESDNPFYLERFKNLPYVPMRITENPREKNIEFIEGNGKFHELERRVEKQQYLVSVSENSTIKVNTHYFPGWKLYVNSEETPINFKNNNDNNLGKIIFSLDQGLYKIDLIYENTFVEKISKIISITTILVLITIFIVLFIIRSKKNNHT